jgi:hypothetical protein
MRGAIPSLPQYVFMACCSVKKSTGTTLPLSLQFNLYSLSHRVIINGLYIFKNVFKKSKLRTVMKSVEHKQELSKF